MRQVSLDAENESVRSPGRLSFYLAIASITIGVIVRLYDLNYKSMWLDEIYTLFPTYLFIDFLNFFKFYLSVDNTPPLFQIILYGWGSLFGYGDFISRLPSALFGVAALIAMYVGLKWVWSSSIAVTATILLSCSWPAIYYSQETRNYSLLLLVCTLLTVAWLRLLQLQRNGEQSQAEYWVLLLLSIVASYTHLYGFILSAFLWTYLFLCGVLSRRRHAAVLSFVCLTGTLAVFLPWLTFNVLNMMRAGNFGMGHIESPGIGFLVDIGAFAFHHPIPAVLVAVIPMALGVKGAIQEIRVDNWADRLYQPLVALLVVMIVPFLAVFCFSQIKPILYTRYLMPFIPVGLIFVSALFEKRSVLRGWQGHLALLGLAILSLAWLLPDHYGYRHKPQTKEAVAYVRDHYKPGADRIIVPCRAEPTWSCRVGAGNLSPRIARYVHYLNYERLPQITEVPGSFGNPDELRELVASYQETGVKRIYLLGARGHTQLLPSAVSVLGEAGFTCSETKFHKAAVFQCDTL